MEPLVTKMMCPLCKGRQLAQVNPETGLWIFQPHVVEKTGKDCKVGNSPCLLTRRKEFYKD